MIWLREYANLMLSRRVWLSPFVLALVVIHLLGVMTEPGSFQDHIPSYIKGFVWIFVVTVVFVTIGCCFVPPRTILPRGDEPKAPVHPEVANYP